MKVCERERGRGRQETWKEGFMRLIMGAVDLQPSPTPFGIITLQLAAQAAEKRITEVCDYPGVVW